MNTSTFVLRNVLKDALVTELALAILDPAVAGTFVGETTLLTVLASARAVPITTNLFVFAFPLR